MGFTVHHVLSVLLPGQQWQTQWIIGEHQGEQGQKLNTGCIFLQVHFQGIFGAAALGAMLLGVIGP